MTDHEKTMIENCNTQKMKNQNAPCHLNFIIIQYRLVMEWQQQFNY